MPKKKKSMPKAPVPDEPNKKKVWVEIQREHEEKLKELLYEDRNGFRPPRPWYEED
jgi:translation initiation factor 1 (eIF-1/SUI1)